MFVEFKNEAERLFGMEIADRVNKIGGYGKDGEVIYDAPPVACPSVLVDQKQNATATFMSNGSLGFLVKIEEGLEVNILESHFDTTAKRETGTPSSNVWLRLEIDGQPCIASIINPLNNRSLEPTAHRLVKMGEPDRAYWYFAEFLKPNGVKIRTAVRLSLVYLDQGPAIFRQMMVKNAGAESVQGSLWTHFNLHGTQRFVYNKDLWYDSGLPLSDTETVASAVVPYSDILQIKRQSSRFEGFKPLAQTCDYMSFVGSSSASIITPQAVLRGELLSEGAGDRMNRFSSPTIAANGYSFDLKAGESAALFQSLLYVTDPDIIEAFRKCSLADAPTYSAISNAFKTAAEMLVSSAPDAVLDAARSRRGTKDGEAHPDFDIRIPSDPVVAQYANSVWTGVSEIYENCRAHGAMLADGIELGTRDRGQDMWPKMKEDPGRVRADLIHAMSFMYQTVDYTPDPSASRLTLREKLHGMFPRQYPSAWRNRDQEVFNDNRPYTDSPLWLINSLCMLIRETGDISLLLENVETIRLTDPDNPEKSGIVGCDKTHSILEVAMEVFASFERHVLDSPYKMAQILYGEWCDPVDMFGTSVVGDSSTRGMGRGSHTRLSAHVVLTLAEFIDILRTKHVSDYLAGEGIHPDVQRLESFADKLRQAVIKTAWEDGDKPGFVNVIHELKKDGSVPAYDKGETGYTLGSMSGSDFDGAKRRDLTSQAYGLEMLNLKRPYLTPVPDAERKIQSLLNTIDTLFYHEKLGLALFTVPIGNNREAVRLVGRMGVVPSGAAENGEYHHAQVMMHRFRLNVAGQADTVWREFKPMMSALRDESIGGPFETPCTSYVSDVDDPHFGQAMYFGLSGSTDWIIEVFQSIAGLRLNLHDPSVPDLTVSPNLPAMLKDNITFRRRLFIRTDNGEYTVMPFTLRVRREGDGDRLASSRILINGQEVDEAAVRDLISYSGKGIEMEIVRTYC
ncbi:MAG: hypothetical protein ABFD83_13125 [Armatimonadota bacterium]